MRGDSSALSQQSTKHESVDRSKGWRETTTAKRMRVVHAGPPLNLLLYRDGCEVLHNIIRTVGVTLVGVTIPLRKCACHTEVEDVCV